METPYTCPITHSPESCIHGICPAYDLVQLLWETANKISKGNPDKAAELVAIGLELYLNLRQIVPDRDCVVLIRSKRN